jgi:hypothetical protein
MDGVAAHYKRHNYRKADCHTQFIPSTAESSRESQSGML